MELEIVAPFKIEINDSLTYGIPLKDILEIKYMQPIVESGSEIKVMVNEKGAVIPVINITRNMGYSKTRYDYSHPVITVKKFGTKVGIEVSSISRMVDCSKSIQFKTNMFESDKFFNSIIKTNRTTIHMLNLENVLKGTDKILKTIAQKLPYSGMNWK
ncbi:MAG: hypothetical protein MAG458_01388 [Nitrosopumilus sp.]|nr:hypothetical protein [Nitrosopumilus sp.]